MHVPSTRRDRRYPLRQGAGSVVLPASAVCPEGLEAALIRISVAGIGFFLERSAARLTPGTVVPGARVRVGECVLEGDLSVRDVHPLAGNGVEVGAVFLPVNRDVESRLMALLAGIRAALAE